MATETSLSYAIATHATSILVQALSCYWHGFHGTLSAAKLWPGHGSLPKGFTYVKETNRETKPLPSPYLPYLELPPKV